MAVKQPMAAATRGFKIDVANSPVAWIAGSGATVRFSAGATSHRRRSLTVPAEIGLLEPRWGRPLFGSEIFLCARMRFRFPCSNVDSSPGST